MKDIYTYLGFRHSGEIVYPNAVIDEARNMLADFPVKNMYIRPIMVEQTSFEEAFAISTAEDSDLTIQEAKKIILSPEIEARLIKYRNDKHLSPEEKYRNLEFENVRAVEEKMKEITFGELTIQTLRDLHYDLTIGLDDYCKYVGISRYYSGELRASDETKVGRFRQYTPPAHSGVSELLEILLADFKSRKNIRLTDILEFHILLYAIHPFSNGNKRVARVLESMLMKEYGYSIGGILSLSMYYGKNKSGTNFFIMESLKQKDPTPFVNFAVRGYLYSVKAMEYEMTKIYLKYYLDNIIRLIADSVSQEKTKSFRDTARCIIALNGVFTHGQFIQLMGKNGYTLGISQELLKYMKNNKYISHTNNLYTIAGASDLAEHRERLLRYYLDNQIMIEE